MTTLGATAVIALLIVLAWSLAAIIHDTKRRRYLNRLPDITEQQARHNAKPHGTIIRETEQPTEENPQCQAPPKN